VAIAPKQFTSKLIVKYTVHRIVHSLVPVEFVYRDDAPVELVSAGRPSASFIPTRH